MNLFFKKRTGAGLPKYSNTRTQWFSEKLENRPTLEETF
jgi:hypothetical protein